MNARYARPDLELLTPRGELRLWLASDSVYLTQISGWLETPVVRPWLDRVNAWAARRRHDLWGFHDWEAMENYDGSARQALTSWTFENRALFTGIHILVRSKIVVLGVEVANLALGRLMVTYRERATFESAMNNVLAKEMRVG
jgi:hypothetical protein